MLLSSYLVLRGEANHYLLMLNIIFILMILVGIALLAASITGYIRVDWTAGAVLAGVGFLGMLLSSFFKTLFTGGSNGGSGGGSGMDWGTFLQYGPLGNTAWNPINITRNVVGNIFKGIF